MRTFAFRIGLVCLISFLIIHMPARAQDDSPYRLRALTLEEYVNGVRDIGLRYQNIESDGETQSRFIQSVHFELKARYTDFKNAHFDLLDQMWTILNPEYSPSYSWWSSEHEVGAPSYSEWHELLAEAWLRENPTDLSAIDTLNLGKYELTYVVETDFNGNGINDVILKVVEKYYESGSSQEAHNILSSDDEYAGYWVVEPDPSQAWGYRTISFANDVYLWVSGRCDFRQSCGSPIEIISIEDVNMDGLPEWMLGRSSCGYGECGGSLTILGYREGELTSLIGEQGPGLRWTGGSGGGGGAILPPEGTWTFQNVDNDPPLELIQRRQFEDNRACEVTYTSRFDWNTTEQVYHYVENSLVTDYADSAACALRQGQDALENSDYEAGIRHYQRAVDLLDPRSRDVYSREAWQYAQARLAISQALAGHTQAALDVIADLQTQTPLSEPMQYMFAALVASFPQTHNPIDLCADVYSAMGARNFYFVTPYNRYAYTDDVTGRPATYVGAWGGPAASGCNVESLLDRTLTTQGFPTNVPPSEILMDEGWTVTNQYKFDLNKDGLDEWMIWITPLAEQPLFFLSENATYRAVYLSNWRIAAPSNSDHIFIRTLPGDVGLGLVIVSTSPIVGEPPPACPETSTLATAEDPTYVSILRLDKEQQPASAGGGRLCENLNVEELFPAQDQLHIWTEDYSDDAYVMKDSILTWDPERQQFSSPDDQQHLSSLSNKYTCGFRGRDFCGFYGTDETALALLEELLAAPSDDLNEVAMAHYYHALLLELNGKPAQALDEYVKLFTEMPDSYWGMLAVLHLER